MSNFLLVQEFDPKSYYDDFNYKPFYINMDYIHHIRRYDPNIHASVTFDDGKETKHIPDGALDSIYIFIGSHIIYHLNPESSKKVLTAIGIREESK